MFKNAGGGGKAGPPPDATEAGKIPPPQAFIVTASDGGLETVYAHEPSLTGNGDLLFTLVVLVGADPVLRRVRAYAAGTWKGFEDPEYRQPAGLITH
jgi:hypothetical protein